MTTRKRAETETLEARYRRYRSILKDLTIMSDVFMRNVLKQKACTEYILRVILERNDLIVVDQVLQKDYKNKYGSAEHLKDCEYRSIRLARSEINMAYRTAENERWKQMDFVVGYEIKLSSSHHHRMPHGDICDRLAGKYPKDFVWTGWHPNDLCYKIPILKTEEEFWEWDGRSESTTESVNEVKDVPNTFKQWIGTNSQRIADAKRNGTLPYFLKDNPSYLK